MPTELNRVPIRTQIITRFATPRGLSEPTRPRGSVGVIIRAPGSPLEPYRMRLLILLRLRLTQEV